MFRSMINKCEFFSFPCFILHIYCIILYLCISVKRFTGVSFLPNLFCFPPLLPIKKDKYAVYAIRPLYLQSPLLLCRLSPLVFFESLPWKNFSWCKNSRTRRLFFMPRRRLSRPACRIVFFNGGTLLSPRSAATGFRPFIASSPVHDTFSDWPQDPISLG